MARARPRSRSSSASASDLHPDRRRRRFPDGPRSALHLRLGADRPQPHRAGTLTGRIDTAGIYEVRFTVAGVSPATTSKSGVAAGQRTSPFRRLRGRRPVLLRRPRRRDRLVPGAQRLRPARRRHHDAADQPAPRSSAPDGRASRPAAASPAASSSTAPCGAGGSTTSASSAVPTRPPRVVPRQVGTAADLARGLGLAGQHACATQTAGSAVVLGPEPAAAQLGAGTTSVRSTAPDPGRRLTAVDVGLGRRLEQLRHHQRRYGVLLGRQRLRPGRRRHVANRNRPDRSCRRHPAGPGVHHVGPRLRRHHRPARSGAGARTPTASSATAPAPTPPSPSQSRGGGTFASVGTAVTATCGHPHRRPGALLGRQPLRPARPGRERRQPVDARRGAGLVRRRPGHRRLAAPVRRGRRLLGRQRGRPARQRHDPPGGDAGRARGRLGSRHRGDDQAGRASGPRSKIASKALAGRPSASAGPARGPGEADVRPR